MFLQPAAAYLALGLNGNLDDWVGEVHALQDDRVFLITQGLTCRHEERERGGLKWLVEWVGGRLGVLAPARFVSM